MNEGARTAGVDDLPVVAELVVAARDELIETKGGAVWARREGRAVPAQAALGAVLDDDDGTVMVGTIDETVVGYAVIEIETLGDGGRLARLTDIFVLPDARSVGVGEALIELVLAWATDAGCFGIDSLALPGNRATKNFFEGNAMVTRALVVHRSLGST